MLITKVYQLHQFFIYCLFFVNESMRKLFFSVQKNEQDAGPVLSLGSFRQLSRALGPGGGASWLVRLAMCTTRCLWAALASPMFPLTTNKWGRIEPPWHSSNDVLTPACNSDEAPGPSVSPSSGERRHRAGLVTRASGVTGRGEFYFFNIKGVKPNQFT